MLHQDKIKYPPERGCSIEVVSGLIKEPSSALRDTRKETEEASSEEE